MTGSQVNFGGILRTLVDADVDFILIGGLAGMAHGSSRATLDVDVVYDRTEPNITKLANCIQPLKPKLRGAPEGLPFVWDDRTIRQGLNFTLSTDIGDVDLLGEVVGGGTYSELLPFTESISIFDVNAYA